MVRPNHDRLAGVVKADETYVGGERAGKRARGAAAKTLVLVMEQVSHQGAGRIRLARVGDASIASLGAALQQAVEPGSARCAPTVGAAMGGWSRSVIGIR